MCNKFFFPLKFSIGKFAYFFRIESSPPFAPELLIKLQDMHAIHEINECKAEVAFIYIVDRQVEDIKFSFKIYIDIFQHYLQTVFVRNVADHKGGTLVFASENLIGLKI